MPWRDCFACFTCDQLLFKLPLALSLLIYLLNCDYPCDPHGDLEWDYQFNRTRRSKSGTAHDCMRQCKIYNLRLNILKNLRQVDSTLELFENVIESTPPNSFCYPPPLSLDRTDKHFEHTRFSTLKTRSQMSYRVLITTVMLSFVALMFQIALMMSAGADLIASFYVVGFFAIFANMLSFSYGIKAMDLNNCDHGESIYDPNGTFQGFRTEYFCNSVILVPDHKGVMRKVKLPNSQMAYFRVGQILKIVNLGFILMGIIYFFKRIRLQRMAADRANLPAIPAGWQE